jgi:hypothetical protein
VVDHVEQNVAARHGASASVDESEVNYVIVLCLGQAVRVMDVPLVQHALGLP